VHFNVCCLFLGLKASLERLQLDYVDVVFANRPDPNTPMEGNCKVSLFKKRYIFLCSFTFLLCFVIFMNTPFRLYDYCCEKPGIYKPFVTETSIFKMLHVVRVASTSTVRMMIDTDAGDL